MTVREHVGRLDGTKVVYVGDGNNVAHSLADGGAKTGMHVSPARPQGYEPDAAIVLEGARDAKADRRVDLSSTSDPREAVRART